MGADLSPTERHDIVLVDSNDVQIGTASKQDAHTPPGQLHRAVSVFLFDRSGRTLLQQRAVEKHHFRGKWSNTCCTHPRPGESAVAAAERRLLEEMGIATRVRQIGTFTYMATDAETGLAEHELDHVLVGAFDGRPRPAADEVRDWGWFDLDELRHDLVHRSTDYTPWLAPALDLAAEDAPRR